MWPGELEMMTNQVDVRLLQAQYEKLHNEHDELRRRSHNGGNGNPPGGGMEKRLEKLEAGFQEIITRLTRVESKIESIEKHGATKADIEAVNARIESMGRTTIQWTIATAVVLAGVAFTAARFIPGGPAG